MEHSSSLNERKVSPFFQSVMTTEVFDVMMVQLASLYCFYLSAILDSLKTDFDESCDSLSGLLHQF